MCPSVSATVQDINTTKLKGVMKNQDIKRQFFRKLDNFHIVFRERQKCLVIFVNIVYQSFIGIVLKIVIFTIFRDSNLFCNKKLFNISLGLCISPKTSKNDFRKSFIKTLLDSIWYVLSFCVQNLPSHFYDLILAWSDCY